MADGGIVTQEPPQLVCTDKKFSELSNHQLGRFIASNVGSPFTKFTNNESRKQRIVSSDRSIEELLEERDDLWREHGRSLCTFLEREHERLLKSLHQEIEQLQRKCGDVTLELAQHLTPRESIGLKDSSSSAASDDHQQSKSTIEQIRNELDQARKAIASFHRSNAINDEKILDLECRRDDKLVRFRDEADRKEKQTNEINAELNRKACVITQIMTQLHQLRLREAVEKQKRQLGEQEALRRQFLTNPSTHVWLQNDGIDRFDPSQSAQQMHRPLMLTSSTPARLRTSILPPISTTTMNNIEKPATTTVSIKSFRRSASFRQAKSSNQY